MRKVFIIVIMAAVFALAIINDKSQSAIHQKDNDLITWQGKGKKWDYRITLIHKPIDEVSFVGHVEPCAAPDYAVEISEGLIYKGHNGSQFTSFKARYEGSPAFLTPISEMSYGSPQGIENGKPYGMKHIACFTKAEWERMQEDTSNTVRVSIVAYPLKNSIETISVDIAR